MDVAFLGFMGALGCLFFLVVICWGFIFLFTENPWDTGEPHSKQEIKRARILGGALLLFGIGGFLAIPRLVGIIVLKMI